MNKIERIQAALSGDYCDQLPYAIWSHLPHCDLDPVQLAEETYAFFKKYDVDFVKTMNNGMYVVEDHNCEIDFSEVAKGGVAKLVSTPIQSPADWDKIQAVSIDEGALKRELDSLQLLLDKVNGEAPVVFTVFSPVTIANKLSKDQLLKHIAEGHGEAIHRALQNITATTAALARRAIELGASGVFFATQLSSYDVTTEAVYREFGLPYDHQVLEAAGEGWFNILHAHGDNIMFGLLKDYPAHVFNWHAWETLPDLDEARDFTKMALMGGLNRMDITNGNRNELHNQIYKAVKILKCRRHILTPGCVIRYPLDEEMLSYVKEAKLAIERAVR